MITKENYLHNLDLIKKSVLKIFENLKQNYGFVEYKGLSKYDMNDGVFLGIKKRNVILYCFISKREAYEFSVLEEGKEKYDSISIRSLFMKKFPPLSKESKIELEKKQLINLIPYSFEYYYENMIWDINFLEKYYPEIFKNCSIPPL